MAYEKTTWVSGVTALSADNLNHIEDGVENSVCLDGDQTVAGAKRFTSNIVRAGDPSTNNGMTIGFDTGTGGTVKFADADASHEWTVTTNSANDALIFNDTTSGSTPCLQVLASGGGIRSHGAVYTNSRTEAIGYVRSTNYSVALSASTVTNLGYLDLNPGVWVVVASGRTSVNVTGALDVSISDNSAQLASLFTQRCCSDNTSGRNLVAQVSRIFDLSSASRIYAVSNITNAATISGYMYAVRIA